MPGIRMVPSAATSATELPEISAKIIEATIDTMASPPRMKPTKDRQKPMSRRDIEVAFIKAPASTNSGMAMSGNFPAPSYSTMAAFSSAASPPAIVMAASATMPSATAIGTSRQQSTRNPESTISADMRFWVLSEVACGFGRRTCDSELFPSFRQGHQFGSHEGNGSYRNYALRHRARKPGNRHQPFVADHQQEAEAAPCQRKKKRDRETFRSDESERPPMGRQLPDDIVETQMAAVQRHQRCTKTRDPRQQDRRNLVIPS